MVHVSEGSREKGDMAPSWQVESCARRKYLFMRLGGFFSAADVALFAKDVADHIRSMAPLPPAGHVSVCDARGMSIQSQEAAAAFSAMLANPTARSRKLGYVAGSALAKVQIRRLTNRDTIAFFDDVAQAEAWVLS
jgi:hypothetical protein